MKLLVVLVLPALLIGYALSTPVQTCSGGPHPLSDNYNLLECTKPPCKLKRNTNITMELTFTPDEDVDSVRNTVYAKIAGIPFPFIGVDGTDACSKIFLPDGSSAGCPLKAGQTYVYKNGFRVLEIYPKLRVVVHWAVTARGNKDLLCFEVPARITS